MNILTACSINQQEFAIGKIGHEFVPRLNNWLPKKDLHPMQLTSLRGDFIPMPLKWATQCADCQGQRGIKGLKDNEKYNKD